VTGAEAYVDVFRRNSRLLVFNDNHRPTDPSPVAGNVHSSVVVVDVYADKLTEFARAPQFPKVGHETCGKSGKTNNGTINVDDEC